MCLVVVQLSFVAEEDELGLLRMVLMMETMRRKRRRKKKMGC